MSNKAPILAVNKQLERACNKFVKLKNYVNSNKRMTKIELKELLDELKKPLFTAREMINPNDEFTDFTNN